MTNAEPRPRGKTILFVTATRIGDAVLSTGILDHLIRENPGARVTVACGPAAAPLFEQVPGLEQLIVLEKQPLSLHWLGLWLRCAGRFWDVVVDLRNAPLTMLLPRRKRFGLGRSDQPRRRVVQIAEVLGLQQTAPPVLWVDHAREQRASELIPGDTPALAIGPAANWRAKTWRADRFVELAEKLTSAAGLLPEAPVAIFGRADERPMVLRVIESIPVDRRIDLVGHLDLLTVFACLRRCALFVGNDSGLMHIAAASGVPTLGLFGPTQEQFYAPWGEHSAVVRTPEEFETIFPENFDYRNSDSLMDSLTVDMVEGAAQALWRKLQGQVS